MLYKRPFAAALEEAIEGTEEIVSEPLTETELEANAEETAELNAEIQQDSNDVEATLEEVDALEEQAAATDEVLAATADEETAGEPVADEASAITEEQVVTAEESYKWTLARLGGAGKYQEVVKIASEAKAAGKTRRERLKICNEGVKETIARLIQSIINMAKQIASRIVIFVKSNLAKFFNYKKTIEENAKIIKGLNAADVNAEDLAKTLASQPSAEMAYILATSDLSVFGELPTKKKAAAGVVDGIVKKLASMAIDIKNSKDVDESKAIDSKDFDQIKAASATALENALDSGKLLGLSANGVKEINGFTALVVYGKTAIGTREGGKGLEKVSLDFASDFGANAKLDVAKLISSANATASKVAKASQDMKVISDTVVKIQKDVEANLKKIESTAKVEGFGKAKAIRAIKAAGIDFSMGLFNGYIQCVKVYARATTALAAYGTKKESKK